MAYRLDWRIMQLVSLWSSDHEGDLALNCRLSGASTRAVFCRGHTSLSRLITEPSALTVWQQDSCWQRNISIPFSSLKFPRRTIVRETTIACEMLRSPSWIWHNRGFRLLCCYTFLKLCFFHLHLSEMESKFMDKWEYMYYLNLDAAV